MKAKFFNTKFFFGVVVVFVVIFMFVVFFNVARANTQVGLRYNPIAVGKMHAMHHVVDEGNAVTLHHYVGGSEQIASVETVDVYDHVNTLDVHDQVATVVGTVVVDHVEIGANNLVHSLEVV